MTDTERRDLAFRDYYEGHRKTVFHQCLRYGAGDRQWAEDVTHDVFLKLWENLARLRDHHDLGGWLYRVTANQAISRLRRDRSLVRRLLRVAPTQQGPAKPDRELERTQDVAGVWRALGTLPDRERVVVCMKVIDGKRQREIAETLEISEGYTSKLLARAIEKLRAAAWDVDDV